MHRNDAIKLSFDLVDLAFAFAGISSAAIEAWDKVMEEGDITDEELADLQAAVDALHAELHGDA